MASLNDIRTAFLEYFKNGNGVAAHEIVPSSPVVPQNDPTLLFTNAGMVPFKNVFVGEETRPYTRAASSQKCIRAGGKHNDLDNVGYTARHHTFFEMLGNFSFGDYFKEEAIFYAWNLLTDKFDIPKERLLVTVYAEDEDAATLWRKISGFDDHKIIRIPTADNFWSMGDTGPCGPCSEIFFDHGEGIPGGPPGSPDEDGDRFIEIWNLVFMQFDQHDGEQIKLPNPSIDTGMGLERIAAVLQGVHDNYDIDLFKALIAASEAALKVPAKGNARASHRVIVDHLRSVCFLLADGVTPSNEGRGYVLRRIMRRAMRHAHLLGSKEPVLHTLVPSLLAQMGDAYPELVRAQALIESNLLQEEERFLRTLGRGMGLLNEAITGLGEGAQLSGDIAFKLYDTYGFPLDLTEDALRGHSIGVDHAGFEAAMATQKAEGRANWKGSGDAGAASLWDGAYGASIPATTFLGYACEAAKGRLLALTKNGVSAPGAQPGDEVDLVFDQTPFYAEAGGQTGDTGRIIAGAAEVVIANTTKSSKGHFIHSGKVQGGPVETDSEVELIVDHERRRAIRANHSATHLLHAAIRTHLGSHVAQKGSYVGPDYLRFDFTHSGPMTAEELERIELEVNAIIRQNTPAIVRETSHEEAIEAGAVALFGEKYGDKVRMLSLGTDINDDGRHYSLELCGGTHVERTGDIALIKITGQSGVAAGIRRIEAMTGAKALEYMREEEKVLQGAAEILKSRPVDLAKKLHKLVEERRALENEVSSLRKQIAIGGTGPEQDASEVINGVKFIGRAVENVPPRDLRTLVDESKSKLGSGIAVFATNNDGKGALAVGVSEDLHDRLNAVDLVRIGAVALGGKGGGGRADFAQAGGPDGHCTQAAIDKIKATLAS